MNQGQKDAKKWFIRCFASLLLSIFLVFLIVWIFDPYFHFHKPFSFVSYRLYDERYTNDGISRHFDYNAIITGTSMAQNFKPSEMDALFGTKSVKETFSGAGFQELSQNLERALQRNKDLKTVLWTLDYSGLIREKAGHSTRDIQNIYMITIHGMMCSMYLISLFFIMVFCLIF